MEIDGRKIVIIAKDDQGKPDLAKTALAEAYEDDGADIAIGTTSSAAAIAMLPVAEEHKKILSSSRRSPTRSPATSGTAISSAPGAIPRRTRSPTRSRSASRGSRWRRSPRTYAFGRDGVAAFKEALAKTGATLAARNTRPPTRPISPPSRQRLFDALKDKPGKKIIWVIWAGGANPLDKLADLDPGRYGIDFSTGGNILPALAAYKRFPGLEGAAYYYYEIPKNPANDWLVAEHQKRFNAPPDFFTAGGFAAAMAVVAAVEKAKSTDAEKLIAAMEGMEFDTPKGKMIFRKEDHQALQSMYAFQDQGRSRTSPGRSRNSCAKSKIEDMDIPIRNKR